MGIMGIDSAKEYAYDKGLDLVLITAGSPPVCRAMDWKVPLRGVTRGKGSKEKAAVR